MENSKFLQKIKDFVGDMFSTGSKGLVGLDIGVSSIKFSEVIKSSEGFKLNRFVSVELPEGTIIEDEIHKEDEILKAIQKGLKLLGASSNLTCLGLSGPNTIIKRLQLPGGPKEEIDDNVNWEIEQYLPYSIDEANISYSIIGENKGGGVDVIIGSAKKSLIESFKELIERSSLRIKVVDLSIAALMNVFEFSHAEELTQENSTWILMDIGAQKSSFLIYKNGGMVFSKEITTGGLTITEEIQRQMGVNYQEAESLKIQGDGSGNIPEEILDIINQVLDTFFAEIKKTIDFWMTNSTGEEFSGCFVTGGTAKIPGLIEALQEELGTETQVLNPFKKFTFNPNNISEDQVQDIVYQGVVSMGLAMRSISK